MSTEQEAGSRVQGARLTAPNSGHSLSGARPTSRAVSDGFSLIELLVVIGLVAILSALVTPAMQGLMGTSGRRGALNTVTAVIEQARLAAIENGTTVYVGFPTNAADPTNGFSHLIIFREPRAEETNTNLTVLTRWQRLPNGVFFQPTESLTKAATNRSFPKRTLPRLGLEDLSNCLSLAFNRFGQVKGATTEEVVLKLGEKILPTGDWRGGANNHFELKIQPLTGRALVRDMLTNSTTP